MKLREENVTTYQQRSRYYCKKKNVENNCYYRKKKGIISGNYDGMKQ